MPSLPFMHKTTSLSNSPLTRLSNGLSGALFGFSIFLVVAGIIGSFFVLQDLQSNKSVDVRSDASTATVAVSRDEVIEPCQNLDVCLETEGALTEGSCASRRICELPPGCRYQQVECFAAPCDTIIVCTQPIEDIFFTDTTQLDTPTFFFDEALTDEVPESELMTGKTYYFSVDVALQNLVKGPTEQLPSFFVSLTSNRNKTGDLVFYNMLTAHQDGYMTKLSGSFVAQERNRFLFSIDTVDTHGETIIQETNYDNNKHQHTFDAKKCANNPDLNTDGKVDLRDFAILSREFLTRNSMLTADINCDSSVDIKDYSIMAGKFTVTQ